MPPYLRKRPIGTTHQQTGITVVVIGITPQPIGVIVRVIGITVRGTGTRQMAFTTTGETGLAMKPKRLLALLIFTTTTAIALVTHLVKSKDDENLLLSTDQNGARDHGF